MRALLPVAAALVVGVLLFVWVTLEFDVPARRTVIGVAAAGAVAICAVMLIVLVVLIQRPLAELHDKIARVRQGDLDAEVSFASRQDDIGQLGRDFNHMLRELRASREEIQRLHATQMSRAEHLATLGELAAGLAHEIRNPLAGIAGVMDIIGRELPATSPAKEVALEAQQEVLRIKRILSDLLDYARPKPPEFQVADLNTTAEHAVMLARAQVISRPITIDFTAAPGLSPLRHDSAKVKQVLLNLLLNAIQAIPTTTQGRIELAVASGPDGHAVLRVSDNGRGIPAENLPNVFRPFFTTKGGGTGLGLSLAHSIVEQHGGRIEVASEIGMGTVFTITLPS